MSIALTLERASERQGSFLIADSQERILDLDSMVDHYFLVG